MEAFRQAHEPAALAPRIELYYPLDKRLGGPQSRSGHCDAEEKYASSYREFNPSHGTQRIGHGTTVESTKKWTRVMRMKPTACSPFHVWCMAYRQR
jgi:hypothetical protein